VKRETSNSPVDVGVLGGPVTAANPIPLTSSSTVDHYFDKLTYSAEGVLYEDDQVQIGVKSRYHGHLGQLAVYIGNKVPAPLTSFTTAIHVHDSNALSVTFGKMPPSVVAPRTQTQQLLHIECKQMFSIPPVLTVSYLAGSHQTISVRLPVVITKFFEHVRLGSADFFERWRLIGGPPREDQGIFQIDYNSAGQLDLAKYRQVVSGHRLNLLDDIDPNSNNLVAAGVLHMSVEGKVGCLLRLEPNREAKLCRLTLRSTSESVASEVRRLVEKPLKAEL